MFILYAVEMGLWLFTLLVLLLFFAFTLAGDGDEVHEEDLYHINVFNRTTFSSIRVPVSAYLTLIVAGVSGFYFLISYFLGRWLFTDTMLPLGLGDFFG
jgi:hypothetical protein